MAAVERDEKGRVKRGALNPGGLTREQREMRDKMRDKLRGDADEVHDALMKLVRDGNAPATIYAHQLLHGKDPDKVEMDANVNSDNPARPLSTADLLAVVAASKPESP